MLRYVWREDGMALDDTRRLFDYYAVDDADAELATLRSRLAESESRYHASQEALRETITMLTVAHERVRKLEEACQTVDAWLVCALITTPEDMMQSADRMHQVIDRALLAEGTEATGGNEAARC